MEILIPIVRHSGVNMKTGRSIKDNDRLELANDTKSPSIHDTCGHRGCGPRQSRRTRHDESRCAVEWLVGPYRFRRSLRARHLLFSRWTLRGPASLRKGRIPRRLRQRIRRRRDSSCCGGLVAIDLEITGLGSWTLRGVFRGLLVDRGAVKMPAYQRLSPKFGAKARLTNEPMGRAA